MVSHANKKRRDHTFDKGDLVLLRLQPYRQYTVNRRSSQKLSKVFFGPFKILERIRAVAYRLELPPGSKIHSVIHISLLKPYFGTHPPEYYQPLPAVLVEEEDQEENGGTGSTEA